MMVYEKSHLVNIDIVSAIWLGVPFKLKQF